MVSPREEAHLTVPSGKREVRFYSTVVHKCGCSNPSKVVLDNQLETKLSQATKGEK
jgi:hypothetical protein